MADTSVDMSDGSDIEVDTYDFDQCLETENDADTRDPIDREIDSQEPPPGPVQNQDDSDPAASSSESRDDEYIKFLLRDDKEDDDFENFEGFNSSSWQQQLFHKRKTQPFTLSPGAKCEVYTPEVASSYFDLFWSDDLWERLVDETNKYAAQQREANPPRPFAPKWNPATYDSLKAFVGLCVGMGVLRLPCRLDYWRKCKWLFQTRFNDVMPRDTFNLLWRYLHLVDNESPDTEKDDRLWKLRWFLDHHATKFKEVYVPDGKLTIDESMVKFKGRLSFRQYLPAKPTKWGIKFWTLAESKTGYMSNFQVYTGREGTQEHGLSHRVVMDLAEMFFGTHAQVYMDNFYTSPQLLHDLYARGIQACGTVRSNRKGLPTDLLPSKLHLAKHEVVIAQSDELSYAVWMDTKPVVILSNFHNPADVGFVSRRVENVKRDVRAPQSLVDYQSHMKGVDLCDQMIGYYLLQHRSRKWWRRIFFYLLQASLHNAYVVAKVSYPLITRDKWPNFQDFVEDVGLELVGQYRARREAPVPFLPGRITLVHEVVRMYEKDKVCRECSVRARPGERPGTTKYGCRQCEEPVHLTCQGLHQQRHNK